MTPSDPQAPVDAMVKRSASATYLFAVGMRNRAGRAKFQIAGLGPRARAEVLGENRTVELRDGVFEDAFAPYGVHIYRFAAR